MSETRLNKAAVRHAYESALDRLARLAMYSIGAGNPKIPDEICDHSRRLAADDLIIFSISARRLIEMTELSGYSKNCWIAKARYRNEPGNEHPYPFGTVSMWTLLGLLVHSKTIELFDDRLQLSLMLSKNPLDVLAYHHPYKRASIDPVCYVRSDKDYCHFFLGDFISKSAALMESVVEGCSSRGLHLDLDWLDDL